jgi:RHS repeat-associated protein
MNGKSRGDKPTDKPRHISRSFCQPLVVFYTKPDTQPSRPRLFITSILNSWLFIRLKRSNRGARELDLETGLQINRNRYLHLQLGRWLTRDPIGYEGSPYNLHEYVSGSPTNITDPTGEALPIIIGIGIGIWLGSQTGCRRAPGPGPGPAAPPPLPFPNACGAANPNPCCKDQLEDNFKVPNPFVPGTCYLGCRGCNKKAGTCQDCCLRCDNISGGQGKNKEACMAACFRLP